MFTVKTRKSHELLYQEKPMTLKEISTSLNVSLDRVYYIFQKLGLKAHCKKEGGKWVVKGEFLLWKIRRENYQIEERKFKRRQKVYAIADTYIQAFQKRLTRQVIDNLELSNELNIMMGRY